MTIVEQQSLLTRFLKGGAWLLGGGAISAVVTGINGIVLARHLEAELYGVFVLVSTSVLLVAALLCLRTSEALVKFLIDFLADKSFYQARRLIISCLGIDLFGGMLSSLVLYFVANDLATFLFNDESASDYIKMFCLVPLLGFAYSSCVALLRVSNKFAYIAFVESAHAIILFVSTICFIFLELEFSSLFYLQVFAYGVRGLLLIVFAYIAYRHLGIPTEKIADMDGPVSNWGSILKLMFNTTLTQSLKVSNTHIDTFLVGVMLNAQSSGVYKLSKNIVQMLAFPTNALFQLSYPEFVRLLNKSDMAGLKQLIRNLILVSTGLGTIYCLGMNLFGDYFISLAVGSSFSEASSLLPILVFGLALNLIAQYWHASLVAANFAQDVVRAMIIAFCLQIIVMLTGLPSVGLIVAAYAYVTYCGVRAMILYVQFGRRISI